MSRAELLYFPGSPFARMTRVLVNEWDLPVIPVELSFPPAQDLFEKNPLGQVPVLILPDGGAHFPTLIILEKLWEMAGQPASAYRPQDARQTLLTILQGGDALVAALYQNWAGLGPVRENKVGYDPAARNLERFGQILDWTEAGLDSGVIPFEISLPSVALTCILLWAEARNGPGWRHRPAFRELAESLERRPSFASTRPQPWTP